MKKFIYSLLSLTTLALSFTACSDDDDAKNPWVDEGDAVYFSASMPSSYVFKDNAVATIPVTVQRVYSDKELTVQIKGVTTTQDITLPSSVSFAAGEKSKTFNLSVNVPEMEYEVEQSVTLELVDDGQVSQWGAATYSFTVNRPAPWKDLGMATYTDFFVSGVFGISPAPTYQVQMQQNELNPGLYRLVNPYGKGSGIAAMGFSYDASQVYYLVINCEDPDGVYIERQKLGCSYDSYGDFYGISYGAYYLENGKTLDDAKAKGITGTFKNGIISFDPQMLLTAMPAYNETGLYYGNSQVVTCVLPGYSIPDYALEVYYEGRTTNTDDETFVNVSVEMGEDIEVVRVGMLNTVDDSDIAYYIQNNMIDSEVVTSSGKVQLPLTSTQSDKYTIVAVGYNDGKAVATANARFLYNPAIESEGWNYIATGNYEYSVFWTGEDPRLNLYQSQEDASVYKIAPWGESTDFYFNWDSEAGTVVVYDQPIDVEYGQYGMVWVGDLEDEDNPSEFDEDTFYFAVVYYVEAGSLGADYESFTITSWNSASEAPANNFVPQRSNKQLKSGLKPAKNAKIKFQGVEVK